MLIQAGLHPSSSILKKALCFLILLQDARRILYILSFLQDARRCVQTILYQDSEVLTSLLPRIKSGVASNDAITILLNKCDKYVGIYFLLSIIGSL